MLHFLIFTILFQLIKERAEELKRQEAEGPGARPKKASKQPLKVFRDGVGKYLNLNEHSTEPKPAKNQEVPSKKTKKDGKYNFGSFDSW